MFLASKGLLRTVSGNIGRRRGTYRSLSSLEIGKDAVTIPSLSASFPYSWLRDSCQCPSCVHPSTRQKLHRSSDFAASVRPTSAEVVDGGLRIKWDSEHVSFYTEDFLARYSSPDKLFAFHRDVQAETWTADRFSNLSREDLAVPYSELSDRKTLLSVYTQLLRYGLVFIRDVPATETSDEKCELRVLGEKLGKIRKTFYGETWDVRNIRNSKNIAYTNLDLGLHMDLLYFKEPPRYQILHCLRNRVRGGHSIFVDALHAAHQLHDASPDAFALLSETPVPFHYINDGHHLHNSHPTFKSERHPSQKSPALLSSVNYSPPFQAPLPASTPPAFYRALETYAARINDPQNCFTHLLREGDAVVFDNRRVLHGRTAFFEERQHESDDGETNRWLKGCYLEEDPVLDRMRVLSAAVKCGSA
ncbi:Clavaminate synthase-like protein [Phellopilus nigrolimitatus]|nr:Clavaminate synthase-like protein [Phellopilus nigrolimitatus]